MKGFILFATGAVAGAITSAVLVKKKALADAQQEIEEVREYYRNKKQEEKKEIEKEEPKAVEAPVVEEEQEVEEKKDYEEITRQYVNYNKPNKEVPERYLQADDEPYVIDPEEFGGMEEEGWDTMTLTYFADKVLVDDVDDVIEDPDTLVGLDNLKIFEEYPDATSVYVRNDIWRTDFEILRDDWKWSDIQEPEIVKEKKPHQL
jgi:hypothetical protein